MNNFNQTTIDYIYTQVEVFNEDFKYVADILLEQKPDIETKKHLAVRLAVLARQYEMLGDYQGAYYCMQSAYTTQMEICVKLPQDEKVYMYLWAITLMNVHLCYKLNDLDAAIEYCTHFAFVAKSLAARDDADECILHIAHTIHLDLARLHLLNKNKEKAMELLDIANGLSSSAHLYTKSIDALNTEYDEISFVGNLGDTLYTFNMQDMAVEYKINRYSAYQSISAAVPYDRVLQLLYLESIKDLAELYKDCGEMEKALQYGLKCKDLATELQAIEQEDKEVLQAMYHIYDMLNLFYRLSDQPEEELATAIDRYHLQQLMQDDDTPMDEETIDELAYDAYLLAQDSEKLGKKEQAIKYYEQAQKWSEMLGGEE